MTREEDVVYETENYWACRLSSGRNTGTYEVYRKGATHSTRCAIIGYRGEEGLRRATAECDRRQKAH